MKQIFRMSTQYIAKENINTANMQCVFNKPRVNSQITCSKPEIQYSYVNTVHPNFYSTQPKHYHDASPELLRKLML